MAAEKHSFGDAPIVCHAWNKDRSQLAISPNNHQVSIYKTVKNTWEQADVLEQHEQRVTGIDWAPRSDLIVTCSADRNAYVWRRQGDRKYAPTLVILRINRSATCVRWSPLENKFAVGSGARLISVCYFDEPNDFWVSKHIKKPLRSTVTCLSWHPNNMIVAGGSTDFKARVFSAFLKEVDKRPDETPWGKKMTFGNLLGEFSNGGGGWVHSVSFSPSGDLLAWVGHDSSVSVVKATDGNRMSFVKTHFLPFVTCAWISETALLAAGHDRVPMTFKYDKGAVTFVKQLEQSKGKASGGAKTAMGFFRGMDSHGQGSSDTELGSTHQKCITWAGVHTQEKGKVTRMSLTGEDGLLTIWKV